MNWQKYINELVKTQQVAEAAIIELKTGEVLASTSGLNLLPSEAAGIAVLSRDYNHVFAQGVRVAGITYMGLKADATSIYGKRGTTGVTIAKSNHVVVVGTYTDGMKPESSEKAIEQLAAQLIQSGH
ncbi:hypothetical protein RMATCC62417_10865 [Rhizopus microsporus]|nr:hypothetical protein RMATCC62417_10865 [Rhizopus microsporus]